MLSRRALTPKEINMEVIINCNNTTINYLINNTTHFLQVSYFAVNSRKPDLALVPNNTAGLFICKVFFFGMIQFIIWEQLRIEGL